jgi:hypothetical protein
VLGAVCERGADRIGDQTEHLPGGKPRAGVPGVGELFLEAVFALDHVIQAGQMPVRVGDFDAL